MLRISLIGLAVIGMSLSAPTIATADPAAPQSDASCSAELADVMTWPTGETRPLVCTGVAWVPVADPYPVSDRWLSYGPVMTLHGEGRRNPTLLSGEWTATPLTPETDCRATQSAVIPGSPTVGPPRTDEGKPGQPLKLAVVPRLFTIELAGDCLWEKNA